MVYNGAKPSYNRLGYYTHIIYTYCEIIIRQLYRKRDHVFNMHRRGEISARNEGVYCVLHHIITKFHARRTFSSDITPMYSRFSDFSIATRPGYINVQNEPSSIYFQLYSRDYGKQFIPEILHIVFFFFLLCILNMHCIYFMEMKNNKLAFFKFINVDGNNFSGNCFVENTKHLCNPRGTKNK